MTDYKLMYRAGDGRTITKYFKTKREALKFAYQKAKNFRSEVWVGRKRMIGLYDGQVICIKNKRFYVTYNHKRDEYGREYILHSDGTLGE